MRQKQRGNQCTFLSGAAYNKQLAETTESQTDSQTGQRGRQTIRKTTGSLFFFLLFDADNDPSWAVIKRCIIVVGKRRPLILIVCPLCGINIHYTFNLRVLLSVKYFLQYLNNSDAAIQRIMRQTQTEQSETQHIFPNGGRRLTHDAPTTAADRPPSSKSQPKSSSKRIRSSIYTPTTGSFPEQGAKQINDKRYSELTTHRCLRDLWENTRRDIVKENTENEPGDICESLHPVGIILEI